MSMSINRKKTEKQNKYSKLEQDTVLVLYSTADLTIPNNRDQRE